MGLMHAKPSRVFLPEDIIEQILLKIQCTKSIIRCTSVCKSWCSLIKSSQFINTHLSRPDNTRYLVCKKFVNSNCYADGYDFSLHSDCVPSEECCTLVFPDGLKEVQIHGCCNGVICYTSKVIHEYNIYLWNPTLRKQKTLYPFGDYYKRSKAIGFWFDKHKNDYVIVKIAYTRTTSSVEVYSLSSKSWKIVNDTCPGASYSIKDDDLVYAEGKLHWLAQHEHGWSLVSLDMNNANFRETLISRSYFPTGRLCLKLVERQDSDWPDQYDNFLGFRNNGEALFLSKHNEVVSYDFGTKEIRDFGLFPARNPISVHSFVESLVLLNDNDMYVRTTSTPNTKTVLENTGKKRVGILKKIVVKICKHKGCFKVDL